MSQKIYLNILRGGVFLSLLSPLLVSGKLFFPYITTKQIFFNILIEILFIFWLAFIVKYPSYQPKKSWITVGLLSFFSVILLSSFFGIDFNLSFWGDVERMLGFFQVVHFLILYFIIVTVFRSWKDWRNLFIVSTVIAVIVCLYGLIKNMHYSTIGNTAYVSGYAIFNIFFALILLFRSNLGRSIKNINWPVTSLYTIAIFIMFAIFRLTNTRGAYVGIGMSVLVMLFLLLVLNKNKKVRVYSLSALAVLIILVSLVFSFPKSTLVKNSPILRTITQISSEAVTFQTRLISWRAAIKDLPNHLILGTGYGNFAITFDKYFDPTFYNYTTAETFFDRAHNNLIDIVSTSGILGLLSYLSIFVAVGYYMILGFRKKRISLTEFVLLTGLIVAYFIQNLAVFDSLVTYIPLMMTLGFIYWLSESDDGILFVSERDKSLSNKEIFTFFFVGIIVLFIMNQYNIKPLKMMQGNIKAQIAFAQNNVPLGIEIYKESLSYNTVLDRDSRDSLITLLANPNILNSLSKEEGNKILDWAIELAEKNVEYNPLDTVMQLQLSQILDSALVFNSNNPQLANNYGTRAMEAVNKAIESSPGKVRSYFQKARIYFDQNLEKEGLETFEYAVSLNEDFNESICHLARAQVLLGKEGGYENISKCLDKGGVSQLAPASFIKQLINYYVGEEESALQENLLKVIKLYERLSQLEKTNPQVFANLANLYVDAGEKEKARDAALKAAELDASIKDAVEEFIRNLGL